ncbi:hypothetical protein [Klebsiella pneumoniae]|uniref:hypothetical protein n=1 Tax=Klebsiella pneumoniae TaxID=573 RepID=UPI003F832413
MSLRSERTKWVMFLPCSGTEAEARHVLDLAYGVLCLERAGIQPQDIFIYIDSPNVNYDSIFNIASTYPYVSKSSSEFFSDMDNNIYENLVIFVTGHGGPYGLDAPESISPNKLISSLKSTPNLKNAIVYLGQCYAGTFNYVNAGKGRGESLDIILVGATNLNQSLSCGTAEFFLNPDIQIPWLANVFLLYVFKWMSSPQDIDGDGIYTIMDSYKFAGVFSNEANKQFKTKGFVNVMDMLQDYVKARDLLKEKVAAQSLAEAGVGTESNANPITDDNADDDLDVEVDCKAKEDIYLARLALHHVHQECWILNSRPAQTIEF